MGWKHLALLLTAGLFLQEASAKDLKITLPKKGELTPVQRLNREGVDALRKNQYEKARTLFYKAYLYDPDDPFTLNNLGYIAELDGEVGRAQEYYAMAAKEPTDAIIDKASMSEMKGQAFSKFVNNQDNVALQVNRSNVQAIRLLSESRAPEADILLQRTLKLDPNNVFTLNNLGVAKEMEGEFEDAIRYYSTAARENSTEPAVVTLSTAWRGKPIAQMASENAKKLQARLATEQTVEARVARLNLRGVSAINRNEWQTARQDFQEAYQLDPNNAFSLNNLGYLSEMEGDRETAQVFYEKAQRAAGSNFRVGLATRHSAEGLPLIAVAQDSDQKVEAKVEQTAAIRRQQGGPIRLKTRDNKYVEDDSQPSIIEVPDVPRPPADNITPLNPVPRPSDDNTTIETIPRPPQ